MSFTANYKVETTFKTFQIIEYLAQHGTTGVSQLSTELDISKSIVHNHVSTLREMGYVIKVNGQYRLSHRFLEIGAQVRNLSSLFYSIGQSAAAVADQFDTAVYLFEREGKTGIVTHVWGKCNLRSLGLGIGDRLTLTDTILGIAVLGELPESERDEILTGIKDEAEGMEDLLSTAVDQPVVTGALDRSNTGTAHATGLIKSSDASQGAIGIQLPADVDQEMSDAIETALVSITTDLQTDRSGDRDERSFATMKHTWFSE